MLLDTRKGGIKVIGPALEEYLEYLRRSMIARESIITKRIFLMVRKKILKQAAKSLNR